MDQFDGIRLQKQIAMGKKDPLNVGNFGVEPLSSVEGTVRPEKHLGDDDRGARSPINGNQANPNHGWD